MNLQLRGKNTEVTEGLRSYIEKRFAKYGYSNHRT